MRFVGAGTPCCERRRRRIRAAHGQSGQSNTDILTRDRASERRPIADGLGRWTVSTIEPVTIQAAAFATQPVPPHDNGTSA
jgi:hypothetical protein